MAGDEGSGMGVHLGRNIDALQTQLQVSDEQMLAALGLSYNRFWDMKRRDWAQKKTVSQVAAALSGLSGVDVSCEQVLCGRLEPERFAERAVSEFLRQVQRLGEATGPTAGGLALPRLHVTEAGAELRELAQVVRPELGEFCFTAAGDAMLPVIAAGDQVVCQAMAAVAEGQPAVVTWTDAGGTRQTEIRRVRHEAERVWLAADNLSTDAFGRRVYADQQPSECEIHGLVLGLWRTVA